MRLLLIGLVAVFTFSSCDEEDIVPDNELPTTGRSEVYNLNEIGSSGVSGTVTFEELADGTPRVTISLTGTSAGNSHPAHIHFNTAAEGGEIAFDLTPVDGSNGSSVTVVTGQKDGSPITYESLIEFDGYVNVHNSSEDLGTILSQGDIGQNVLTGTSKTYELSEKAVPGISGNATFSERKNGTTLVTIQLSGTPEGGIHPSHIHENDAATGGGIAVSLTPVDGNTGLSKTQVETDDTGANISYDELIEYNGYINVHLSETELATIVAQGNIGSNEGIPIESPSTPPTEAVEYDVTNSGSAAYIFNGGGLNDASNPDLTLQRGKTYEFNINSPGHPFFIKTVQGSGNGNAYDDGVTNNGIISGTITFTVPSDAPNTLFYNCEFHGVMTGTISITD